MEEVAFEQELQLTIRGGEFGTRVAAAVIGAHGKDLG